MNNKKLGGLLLGIGVVLGLLIFQITGGLYNEAELLGCFQNEDCATIESKVSASHFMFGVLGFLLALGVYLLVFSKSEEALIRRIETREEKMTEDEKFALLLKGLDKDEKEVISIIKEQEGITQSTLRIKTNLSKAKLSYVLQDLEEKQLIRRIKKGKSLALFLK